jgi:hypothetical protein
MHISSPFLIGFPTNRWMVRQVETSLNALLILFILAIETTEIEDYIGSEFNYEHPVSLSLSFS